MAVDLEAIARRGRCDASSLKIALPLLEQGYSAPFLARYRRDELGGLDESTLWNLKTALDAEKSLADFRDKLQESWQTTPLCDPAIGEAIRKSGSKRTLQRLSKRLRQESSPNVATDSIRLAARLLSPQKGDPQEAAALAESMETIEDKAAAVDQLPAALLSRLVGDPRMISAAVRWLSKNARIHVSDVHDPHIAAAEEANEKAAKADAESGSAEAKGSDGDAAAESGTVDEHAAGAVVEDAAATNATPDSSETPANPGNPSASEAPATEAVGAESEPAVEAAATDGMPEGAPSEDQAEATPDADVGSTPEATSDGASESQVSAATQTTEEQTTAVGDAPSNASKVSESEADLPQFQPDTEAKAPAKKEKKAAPKKQKKISPRQRRRRWLVNVLKPLEGKRMPATKLSAFQVVMLGRALRSQVAVCAFEYDAAKLVAEIKRVAIGLNRSIEPMLTEIVMQHEADIREAGEAAWWDELHERASARLVSVAADHLRAQVNRGPIDAKVIMSIDAVGPKTAATSIVSADGRVLKGEDLPCQLTSNVRSETVAKMGELIHQFNVDLVVISNGPARRACLIALGDLIEQSPNEIRWTVADRSGADSYAGGEVANSEMRSTPRRFRAAAWLAFSVVHPAQAYAKVDPLRLRLASFQSELAEEALSESLGNIIASGASRGGVDANAAPVSWLSQLPGMNETVAKSLAAKRESELLKSRDQLLGLEGWQSTVESRQAMPFLRVFQSEETLDGTLIHPDDYALAKKLAKALEIELPPDCPPGYEAPDYNAVVEGEPKLVDATTPADPTPVEDFDRAGEKAGEFALPPAENELPAENTSETDGGEASAESAGDAETPVEAASDSETPVQAASDSEAANADDAANPTSNESEESSTGDESAAPTAGDTESGEVTAESETTEGEAKAVEPETAEPEVVVHEQIKRPRPEKAKIDKCIKEWQVGKHRVQQLVGWLCDPFGETAITNDPPGVLKTMPTLKTLKPGDQVIGVVVGVMNFGVFVELAPDCSGLVHVSRLSDGYVEDLNEAVQVGDVITAWVTGIDEKRRRVGLTALSPEQEAQLAAEQSRDGGRGRGGQRGGQQRGGQGQNRGGQGRGGQGGQTRGAGPGQSRGGQGQNRGGQGQSRGGQSRDQAGSGQGRGGKGQGRGGQARGGQGRGRDNRSRDGGRGGRKPRQPESYRVVAKPEDTPISDAMQSGDEPLRSFGDLMQFYSGKEKDKQDEPKSVAAEQETPQAVRQDPPEESKPTESPSPAEDSSAVTAAVENVEPPANESTPETKETESDQ
ncbi:MAG: S1 RNA-binding domain-containing protein [Planctomycetota bacterium]